MASPTGVPMPRARESQIAVPTVWNVPAGPPPSVNQLLLHAQTDADGGPAEIVVHLGYALSPPQAPEGGVPVTTVASFSLTRHRAQQLQEFLGQQIDHWDKMDEEIRRARPGEGGQR